MKCFKNVLTDRIFDLKLFWFEMICSLVPQIGTSNRFSNIVLLDPGLPGWTFRKSLNLTATPGLHWWWFIWQTTHPQRQREPGSRPAAERWGWRTWSSQRCRTGHRAVPGCRRGWWVEGGRRWESPGWLGPVAPPAAWVTLSRQGHPILRPVWSWRPGRPLRPVETG